MKNPQNKFLSIAVLCSILIGGAALFLSLDNKLKLETSIIQNPEGSSVQCEIITGNSDFDPTRGDIDPSDIARCSIITGNSDFDPTRTTLNIITGNSDFDPTRTTIVPEQLSPYQTVLHLMTEGENGTTIDDLSIITGNADFDPTRGILEVGIITGNSDFDPTRGGIPDCAVVADGSESITECQIITGNADFDPTREWSIMIESTDPADPVQFETHFEPVAEGQGMVRAFLSR